MNLRDLSTRLILAGAVVSAQFIECHGLPFFCCPIALAHQQFFHQAFDPRLGCDLLSPSFFPNDLLKFFRGGERRHDSETGSCLDDRLLACFIGHPLFFFLARFSLRSS